MKHKEGDEVRYYDNDYNLHEAEFVERNGGLVLVKENGVEKYVYDFMLD